MSKETKNMDETFSTMMSACENKIEILETNLQETKKLLNSMKTLLAKEKEDIEKMMQIAKKYEEPDSEIIKLNVGGTNFSTLKSTLTKKIKKQSSDECHEPHLLQLFVSGIAKVNLDENKAIFIDRNPQYFRYILDYLRYDGDANKSFKVPKLNKDAIEEFREDAEFYNLSGLSELLDLVVNSISSILTNEKFEDLNELCKFGRTQKWSLLYRGSLHGFESSNFHDKCDGATNTLTIVKTTLGYVFGGYTTSSWDKTSSHKYDANAFIFSFINQYSRPSVLRCITPQYAIFCHPSYGPSFGNNYDILIASNGNTTTANYSHPYSFSLPDDIYGNIFYDHSYLAGAGNFQVTEIEVFKKA